MHGRLSDPASCQALQYFITHRRSAAGKDLPFGEKWWIALAHIRAVRQGGFTADGVVVDADCGSNAALCAVLERMGLRYGVAIRGDTVFDADGHADTARVIARAPRRRLADRQLGPAHGAPDRHVLRDACPGVDRPLPAVVALGAPCRRGLQVPISIC